MLSINCNSQEDAELLLCSESEEDRNAALAFLYDHFKSRVASFIRGKFPFFEYEQVHDVITNAFLELQKTASKTGFDPEGVHRLIFTIAHRRAIDLKRMEFRWERIKDKCEQEGLHQQAIQNQPLPPSRFITAAEKNEIRAKFATFVQDSGLKRVQLAVARVMAEDWRSNLPPSDIRDIINSRPGFDVTLAGAKRAKEEVLRKFKEYLKV